MVGPPRRRPVEEVAYPPQSMYPFAPEIIYPEYE